MWSRFIEDVFIINLLERPDRLLQAEQESQQYDLGGIIWAAEKDEDGRTGLKKTMLSIFEMCIDMDYERVLILEDDFKIMRPDFNDFMNECIKQLPPDFDIFYLGGNIHGNVTRYSENLVTANQIYSTHAVVYSKKAIQKIIPLLSERAAYDEILVRNIQNIKNTYCAYPMLVTQKDGYSDIEKRNVKYDKFLEKRFEEKTRSL